MIPPKSRTAMRDEAAEKRWENMPSFAATDLFKGEFKAGWDARDKLDDEQIKRYKTMYSNCSKSHDKLSDALKIAVEALDFASHKLVSCEAHKGGIEPEPGMCMRQCEYKIFTKNIISKIRELRGEK